MEMMDLSLSLMISIFIMFNEKGRIFSFPRSSWASPQKFPRNNGYGSKRHTHSLQYD